MNKERHINDITRIMILIYERRVSVGNNEVVLDVKGGDGHTIM